MSRMVFEDGALCRECRASEASCAWGRGCCSSCTHWLRYDVNGNDALPAPGRRRLPVEHGTDRGYHQHRTRHELPCQSCRLAHGRRVIQTQRSA